MPKSTRITFFIEDFNNIINFEQYVQIIAKKTFSVFDKYNW
jgi:hypothetical protein